VSKTLRPAYQSAIESGVAKIAYCLRIERTDGFVLRVTSHDRQLMMNNGVIYHPDEADPDATAITLRSDAEAATIDLEGALTDNGVSREDVIAGLFDFARVFLFRTLWDDPHEDDEEMAAGFIGETRVEEQRYVAELRSLATRFGETVGRVHGSTCDADLGDGRCKVRLAPPEWQPDTFYEERPASDAGKGAVVRPTTQNTRHFRCVTPGTSGSSEPAWDTTIGNVTADGTAEWEAIRALDQDDAVVSVTSRSQFSGDIGFPDDWFGGGTVEMTSGANAGIKREVSGYVGDTYTLWVAFPFDIEAGDQYTAQAGCRKRLDQDCIAKFDNAHNHRAFPHLPGKQVTSRFGGQT